VVSFKLETDPSLLVSKSRQALHKYGHSLVVGNLLTTRAREVILVSGDLEDQVEKLVLEEQEMLEGKEIEEEIVKRLVHIYRMKKWLTASDRN